jgi:hypothetical protein
MTKAAPPPPPPVETSAAEPVPAKSWVVVRRPARAAADPEAALGAETAAPTGAQQEPAATAPRSSPS